MNITTHQSSIHTIRPGDKNFNINDKFVTAQRAGFEITGACPENYAKVIVECVNQGWLKPVANITERELLFIGLSNEQ
jgi:hypothetical protein